MPLGTVATVAIVPLGTVATIQNLGKKKVAHETKVMQLLCFRAFAHVNNCENIINLLNQYNNIYINLHKYLKGKKKTQTNY